MNHEPVSTMGLPALDPDMDCFLKGLIAGNPAPPEPTLSAIVRMREAASRVRLSWADSVPEGAARHDEIETSTGPVPLTIHLPDRVRPTGTLLFLHGGGWTIFDCQTHAPLMRALAAKSGWAIVGFDYPRAPEVLFPGPVQACAEVAMTLLNSQSLALPKPIALCGDSSGANLAVAATLLLRDAGISLPAALLLFYGVYDCDFTRSSYAQFGSNHFPLSTQKMAWFWDRYCPDMTRRREPLASPIYANLAGLPPTHLVVAGQDILRDENLAMVTRLAEAGVRVSLDFYPAAIHAFCEAVGLTQAGRRAICRSAEWLSTM